jgi:hypothetical protein
MNVYVEVVGEAPIMQFVMGDREEIVSGELVDEAAGKYVYKFVGIEAYNLAEDFSATLILNETEIDSVVYSVEAYLIKLANSDVSDSVKAIIADVIEYAQAAEAYVEKEVGVQDIEGLTPTEYVDLTATDSKKTESTDSSVAVTRVFVDYSENLKLNVIFRADDAENVTVKVNGVEVDFVAIEEGYTIYVVSSDALYVTNAAVKYTFEIFVGETKVQTVVYNLKSYLYEVQNDEDAMSNLLKTAYNLSLSAKAYAAQGE